MAHLFIKDLEDNGKLAVWEISESEEELRNLCQLSDDEEEDLLFIKSPARRKERLATIALLGEMFEGKELLGHHDNGRPYLQNSHIEISISHTDRFVAILTHPSESVGIDIADLTRDYSAVEKKALSLEEIGNLYERKKQLHLALHWAAKEAIYKRMSQSDVDFAKQIRIERFSPKESGEITALFISKDGEESEFELSFDTFADHVMVWLIG